MWVHVARIIPHPAFLPALPSQYSSALLHPAVYRRCLPTNLPFSCPFRLFLPNTPAIIVAPDKLRALRTVRYHPLPPASSSTSSQIAQSGGTRLFMYQAAPLNPWNTSAISACLDILSWRGTARLGSHDTRMNVVPVVATAHRGQARRMAVAGAYTAHRARSPRPRPLGRCLSKDPSWVPRWGRRQDSQTSMEEELKPCVLRHESAVGHSDVLWRLWFCEVRG